MAGTCVLVCSLSAYVMYVGVSVFLFCVILIYYVAVSLANIYTHWIGDKGTYQSE